MSRTRVVNIIEALSISDKSEMLSFNIRSNNQSNKKEKEDT